MARVVVNTQNFMFADLLRRTLDAGDFSVTVVREPGKVLEAFNRTAANMVLLEVTGHEPWSLEARLQLGRQMKRTDPDCKVVFLVDETGDKALAQQVKQAKLDGLIDQFVYTSISATYLRDLMETT